ncbi:protein of unknown function DUF1446 [Caldalkalibacillus thermarum TA2.A1]|uniref:DUF1446 domain-containing protein n=1 Tax=Caldalkalibacillus thermarum (strain TA2.A1) TaxID=986075 RepID=F5L3Y0_CALTT|nr:acyclic terpene utilization AtuA family protein [Caldalkalibacillus thermarum]EGL83958.1 protein of unknown function DUF1446 [Caldalkalibacillus thermarum TA2.A1]QZT35065.1 DUF1446 domain-containing protein [Caldalkalibacillus thermarum TA2.A1]
MKKVRVGAGQGFYGDTIYGALNMAKYGNVQYICFDCLAELTMAILQKDRQKDPSKGYTKDITVTAKNLLPYVKEKGIKLITNAGGINPEGARNEVVRIAKEMGITGIRVGIATGDNIYPILDELQEKGISLADYETGEPFTKSKEEILFASAYLGAWPIVECLKQGADIVITGRTTDTAQFLAPMIYELGWAEDDWDKLALGVLLGHLMECSGQATGGNFSGDWWNIPNMENIGYPIAEVYADGTAIITKPDNTGGRVSIDTLKEQFLYEIHDPSHYVTPDVIADFSAARFEEVGPDRVQISGVKGKPKPPTLKAIMGYPNGYMGAGMIGYSWPDALKKARKVDEIIRKQIELYELKVNDIHTEYIGYNSIHGPLAHPVDEEQLNEVYVRIAVHTDTKEEAVQFGRLFPPLALNGPPFVGGLANMYTVRQLLGLWSVLIPRAEVESRVQINVEEV